MKKAYLICIAVAGVMHGCSPVGNVAGLQQQVQVQEQEAISPFALEYNFVETLPNPVAGGNRKRRFLQVSFNATYKLSQEIIGSGGQIVYSHTMNGVLFKPQLAKLEQIMKKLDMPTISQSEISLVRGYGVEYGWGGYVKFAEAGRHYHTKFTSEYSPERFSSSASKERLLTFIRDMDKFFQTEFNL